MPPRRKPASASGAKPSFGSSSAAKPAAARPAAAARDAEPRPQKRKRSEEGSEEEEQEGGVERLRRGTMRHFILQALCGGVDGTASRDKVVERVAEELIKVVKVITGNSLH